MAIATLTVDILAKLAKFEADMGRMSHIVDKSANRLASAMRGLGAAVSFGAITAGFERLVDSAAALDDMAEKTGASVEELSKLEHVARISGTSLEFVETSLIRLAVALHSTDEESKGADKALKAIGLSVDALKGLDTAVALKKVADGLNKFEDSAGKAAVAKDLLGKSGAQALPYLKDLAEAGEVNATLTKEQAAAAEKFQKELNKLGALAGANARVFAIELLPALAKVGDAIGAIARLAEIAGKAIAVLAHGAALIKLPFAESPEDAKRMLAEFDAIRKLAGEDLDEVIMRPTFSQQLASGGGGTAGGLGSLSGYTSKAGKGDKKKGTDDEITQMRQLGAEYERLFSSAEKYVSGLDAQIAKGGALTQSEQQLLEIERQLPPEWAAAIRPLLERADALEKQLKLMEEGKRLFEETRTQMEQLAATEAHLAELLDAGAISWDTYSRAVFAAGEKLEGIKEPLDQMTEFTKEAARNMQDAMADGFFDIMQGKFGDMATSFKQTIDRMVANLLASQLMNFLTGDFGKTGNLGGWLGGLIDGMRAEGGPVAAGSAYLVGERGPELFMPRQSGTIIPNGGGAVAVYNTFTISGTTDRRSQQQIAAEVGAAVDRAVRRNR